MNEELLNQIESMSEVEIEALLETQFPEELEKQAAAEIAESELAEALYTYGALSAERAIAELEGEGDLSKVASEEEIQAHIEAEASVGDAIEAVIAELGLAELEDEVELHKTAQACAAVIFEGYADSLEKIAAKKGSPGMMRRLKDLADSAKKKTVSAAEAAKKNVLTHSGKYGLGAGLGAGAAGMSLMAKKASDMTVGELVGTIGGIAILDDGIEKLAKRGKGRGQSLMEKMKSGLSKAKSSAVSAAKGTKKHVLKHSGKYGLGAGLAAVAALHHLSKRD